MGQQQWRPTRPEFICQEHGIVEPSEVPEEIREFKNCRMTIVRMERAVCGRMLARDDPEWKELRRLWAKTEREQPRYDAFETFAPICSYATR